MFAPTKLAGRTRTEYDSVCLCAFERERNRRNEEMMMMMARDSNDDDDLTTEREQRVYDVCDAEPDDAELFVARCAAIKVCERMVNAFRAREL